MMDEPGRLLALQHLVQLSAEIEVQLASSGWEPLKAVLVRAQDEAADAVTGLMDADPTDKDEIRALQNKVWRYRGLVLWLREIVAEGKEASNEIDEAKADAMSGLISDLDDETRTALGLREPGAGTE